MKPVTSPYKYVNLAYSKCAMVMISHNAITPKKSKQNVTKNKYNTLTANVLQKTFVHYTYNINGSSTICNNTSTQT